MPPSPPSPNSMEIDIPSDENPTVKPDVTLTYADIAKNLQYIDKGVELNQPRLIQRAIRSNANIRRNINSSKLINLVNRRISPSSPLFVTASQAIEKIKVSEGSAATEGGSSMDSSAVNEEDDSLNEYLLDDVSNTSSNLPELEIYIATLVLTTLVRMRLDEAAAFFSTCLTDRLRTFNRRSLDHLSAKAFFYFSLSYERVNRLENIRSILLGLYRTACLHHDEMCQVVLLNLILRNFLQYNLIEQAQTFASKAPFPEEVSNNQYCRYLYYMGRIHAIQLEYSESYMRLTQAIRKAPNDMALGFTLEVQKLAVIVQLLMGDIPDRSVFNQLETRSLLKPYLSLTQAVRTGDVLEFNKVVSANSTSFKADKTFTLVQRLGHNVLKTGLRKLSISYSRISLADIATKLHLPSTESAEYICAKAIRDGVIEANIDHEKGWIVSGNELDVYSTEEPQKAFHRRIAFCLDSHNEAVKAMRYPPDAYKKELNKNKNKNKKDNNDEERTIEEIIKEMEDDMDEL